MNDTSRQPILEYAALTGVRVAIRPVTPADAAVLFPFIHGREPILKWLIWNGPADVEELEAGYVEWRKESPLGDSYHFAIVDLADECACGTIGARFLGHPFTADLGYWLAEERQGRGLVTEAIGLLARLCFGPLESRALTAEVFVGNDGSARVLEKNHFTREIEAHTREMPDGTTRQAFLHTLTARRFARTFEPSKALPGEVLVRGA